MTTAGDPILTDSITHSETPGNCRRSRTSPCVALTRQLLSHTQAEAERFVTRPFLMGTHDAPQVSPSPLQAGAALRAKRSDLQTRKTTSVFAPAP